MASARISVGLASWGLARLIDKVCKNTRFLQGKGEGGGGFIMFVLLDFLSLPELNVHLH